MSRFAYLISVVAVIAPPALAQSSTPTVQTQAVPTKDPDDPNRIICKRQDSIKSRLGSKKVCLTVQEWNERAAQDRDETGRVQRDTQLGRTSG